MSIITGQMIETEQKNGRITITPFDKSRINPNSYNLRLGKRLLVYIPDEGKDTVVLDMKKDNPVSELEIGKKGVVLLPGILYLGETMEHTETPHYVPIIEGRSSVGRLGIQVHVTAGFGDIGFKGKWTLEITVVHPVRVYAEVEICQIAYTTSYGKITPYQGKYSNQKGAVPSCLFQDFK
jgi:dCTP deaminase